MPDKCCSFILLLEELSKKCTGLWGVRVWGLRVAQVMLSGEKGYCPCNVGTVFPSSDFHVQSQATLEVRICPHSFLSCQAFSCITLTALFVTFIFQTFLYSTLLEVSIPVSVSHV